MNPSTVSQHFQGLRTVIYVALDLEKTKAWYSSILGITPYFDQPFYVGFNVGGYELGLDPDSAGAGGGAIVYWGVADASAALGAAAFSRSRSTHERSGGRRGYQGRDGVGSVRQYFRCH